MCLSSMNTTRRLKASRCLGRHDLKRSFFPKNTDKLLSAISPTATSTRERHRSRLGVRTQYSLRLSTGASADFFDLVERDAKQTKEKGKATSLTPLRRAPRSYQSWKKFPRLRLPLHHIPDSGHDTFLTSPPPHRTETSALMSPAIRSVSPKPRPENPHICIQYIHLPRQREPEQV